MITHVTPEDLEQEELEAYAEEYAALKDFEDVDGINWSLSDFEDGGHAVDHDTDMSWPGVFSFHSSLQSRVILTSGSTLVLHSVTFRTYIALAVISDPQRALNVQEFRNVT